MEPQTGSYKPDERRGRIQLDPRKISIAGEIAIALVSSHPQPIVHRLQRQLNVFGRLQLDHNQPAAPRDPKEIENSTIPHSERGYLRIQEARIELGIQTRGVFAENRLQP